MNKYFLINKDTIIKSGTKVEDLNITMSPGENYTIVYGEEKDVECCYKKVSPPITYQHEELVTSILNYFVHIKPNKEISDTTIKQVLDAMVSKYIEKLDANLLSQFSKLFI